MSPAVFARSRIVPHTPVDVRPAQRDQFLGPHAGHECEGEVVRYLGAVVRLRVLG